MVSGSLLDLTVNLSLGGGGGGRLLLLLLLLPPSDCPAPARPLKFQPPTDQILVIKSADQLTLVELTVLAFVAPFEVSAPLIIGRGPSCRKRYLSPFVLLGSLNPAFTDCLSL